MERAWGRASLPASRRKLPPLERTPSTRGISHKRMTAMVAASTTVINLQISERAKREEGASSEDSYNTSLTWGIVTIIRSSGKGECRGVEGRELRASSEPNIFRHRGACKRMEIRD